MIQTTHPAVLAVSLSTADSLAEHFLSCLLLVLKVFLMCQSSPIKTFASMEESNNRSQREEQVVKIGRSLRHEESTFFESDVKLMENTYALHQHPLLSNHFPDSNVLFSYHHRASCTPDLIVRLRERSCLNDWIKGFALTMLMFPRLQSDSL